MSWPFAPRLLQLDLQEEARPTLAWDVRGDVTRGNYRYLTDAEGSRLMAAPPGEFFKVSQSATALDKILVYMGWSVQIPVEINLLTGTERTVEYPVGVQSPNGRSLSYTYDPETGRATGIAALDVTGPEYTMHLSFDALEPNPAVDLTLPR